MTTKNRNLVLSAFFLALCMVLPFLTGQIQQIGSMLLPMHLPVLLCGIVCGWPYALAVGFIAPLLRFMLFGMPPIYPIGLAMCFELATYGVVIALCYLRSNRRLSGILGSLVISMLAGRLVWGAVRFVMAGLAGSEFPFAAFLSGALLTAIPGIILQLILIPIIVLALQKAVPAMLPAQEKS